MQAKSWLSSFKNRASYLHLAVLNIWWKKVLVELGEKYLNVGLKILQKQEILHADYYQFASIFAVNCNVVLSISKKWH